MVFCSNCGVKGADGGKFCMECGTPLSTSAGKPPPPYPGVPSKATAGKKPGVPDQKYTVPSAVPLAASPLAAAPQPQQSNQAPPGHFKVQVPMNAVPGQMMQVQVPAGYAEAGQMSVFHVPANVKPGGFLYAPLPTSASNQAAGGNFNAPYGAAGNNGGYGMGGGFQQQGMYGGQPPPQYNNNRPGAGTTALAAGAGALGGFMLADALFDF